MTLPVGIATYFLLPDTPHTTRVWFLSKKERQLAKERVLKAGKAAPVEITTQTFKKILGSWKWYAFVLGYVVSILMSESWGHHLTFKLAKLALRVIVWRQQLLWDLAQIGGLFRG